jgi:hypothetical protein
MRAQPRVLAASVGLAFCILSGDVSHRSQISAQQSPKKVDMGDYEPVVPWPKPLPDTDLSHDGWTWGSGAGVWAESPTRSGSCSAAKSRCRRARSRGSARAC